LKVIVVPRFGELHLHPDFLFFFPDGRE
jgi:hypothetical protein